MVESTMGLKKIFCAESEANASESSGYNIPAASAEAWNDLGDVYQETCTLKDGDSTVTVHKSETSAKKLIQIEPGDTVGELSLMDPNLEQLARYFGGEIVTDATTSKKRWVKPRKLPYKEYCIKFLPEEGLMVVTRAARIVPTFSITYSSKGICLVPMKIEFMTPLEMDEDASNPTEIEVG